MEVSFSVFKVGEKKTEKSPDYTGSVEVNGTPKHDIAIWESVTKDGRKYWSGKIRPMREKQDRTQGTVDPVNRPKDSDFDPDLPF